MRPVVPSVHKSSVGTAIGIEKEISTHSVGSAADGQVRRRKRSTWRPGDWILGTSQGQWTFLLVVGTGFIFIGSLLWHMAGGNADYDSSFRHSLWISWGFFVDPGTHTGIPPTDPWYIQVVAVVMSILGFIFNLAVLGLVVDMIRGKLNQFQERRSRVVANGHILILGWGDKTLFLLSELTAADRASHEGKGPPKQSRHCARRCLRRCKPIVILAPRPVFEMEQAVALHLGSYGVDTGQIIYRQGDPTDCAELAKVSAAAADDILLMGSTACTGHSSDQGVVQSLLALAALPDIQDYCGDVFVEMQTTQGLNVARELLPIAEGIVARHAVNNILVLRSLAPPIGYCFLDLVSFKEGQELYVRPVPQELVGTAFWDACRYFPEAVVCGVRAPCAEAEAAAVAGIVPDRGRALQANDLLVIMAPDVIAANSWQHDSARGSALTEVAKASRIKDRLPDGRSNLGPWNDKPRIVLVIGCPTDCGDILEIMDGYLAPGSVVHLLSGKPIEQRMEDFYRHFGARGRGCRDGGPFNNISLVHKVGPTTCKWALSELPLDSADCVVILSEQFNEDESPTASDSRNLTTVISIRGLLRDVGRIKGTSNCKVVTELLDPRSEHVVEGNNNVRRHGSFVYSNALETALFAMAAQEKLVYSTLMQLLTRSSSTGRIAAIPIKDLVAIGETLSYMDLHSRVSAACGGILLGWKQKGVRYPELNPKDKSRCRIKMENDMDVLLVLWPTLAPPLPKGVSPVVSNEDEQPGPFPGMVCSDSEILQLPK